MNKAFHKSGPMAANTYDLRLIVISCISTAVDSSNGCLTVL